MKIQYCSDLHMEFHENMRFMKSLPLEPVGDVLVIAGDVGYLVDSTIPHLRFWKWASENYRQALMIAGNHEFYNNSLRRNKHQHYQRRLVCEQDVVVFLCIKFPIMFFNPDRWRF